MVPVALFELEYERYRVLRQAVETRLLAGLAAPDAPAATAQILLEPPRAPVVTLAGEPAALRPEEGAVTVTVFCDYASPHCASLQPLLADLTTLYPDTVRIAARDLPLPIHPHAAAAQLLEHRVVRRAARDEVMPGFHLAAPAGQPGHQREGAARAVQDDHAHPFSGRDELRALRGD